MVFTRGRQTLGEGGDSPAHVCGQLLAFSSPMSTLSYETRERHGQENVRRMLFSLSVSDQSFDQRKERSEDEDLLERPWESTGACDRANRQIDRGHTHGRNLDVSARNVPEEERELRFVEERKTKQKLSSAERNVLPRSSLSHGTSTRPYL